MPTTAVRDRSVTDLDACKAFLKVSGSSEDGVIQTLLDAAKDDADSYLSKDFTDPNGVPLDIPAYVERWLLKEVHRDYENRPAGLTQEAVSGLGTVTWAERDYSGLFRGWQPFL